MATRLCPQCHATAIRFLPAVSKEANVNYYRCDTCSHVFTVPKSAPNAAPKDITEDD